MLGITSAVSAVSSGTASQGLNASGAFSSASALASGAGQTSGAAAPFASLLSDAVGELGSLESTARGAIDGLMTGSGVDVHEAVIAAEKADMAFELALSVRNKAVAAYQQVMGMQF